MAPQGLSPQFVSTLLELAEAGLGVIFLWYYTRVVYGSFSSFAAHLRAMSVRASARLGYGKAEQCRRRRRYEQTSISTHKYPMVLVRRVPDDSLVEEHSPPTLIRTAQGRSLLVRDPHRWLEDESTLRSKIWIKAQRAFTTRYLKTIIRRETIESFESKIRRSSEFEEVGAYFQRGSNFFYFGRWASATTISSDAAEGQYRLYVTEDLSKEGRVLLDPSTPQGRRGRTSFGARHVGQQ